MKAYPYKTIILMLALCLSSCRPEQGEIMYLWEGDAPGSEHLSLHESRSNVNFNIFKPNRSIRQIQDPSLEVFYPENPNGTSVVICPGGGYWMLIWDREGIDIAKWFNSIGITAFVLKYRLPNEGHRNGKDVPLQDAQRAIRLIRANAQNWELNPDRIGILGTSAGGHLAAMLGTSYYWETYAPRSSLDRISPRPNFVVLLYPVITMDSEFTHLGSLYALLGKNSPKELIHQYSADKQVDENTPPVFTACAVNDHTVHPENSKLFHQSLQEEGIPNELHLFPHGGHGFSVNKRNYAGARWPGLCKKWLNRMDLI